MAAKSTAREETGVPVPLTAFVSPRDGVIAYLAQLDRHTPHAAHAAVEVVHGAYSLSPAALWAIVDVVSQSARTAR